MTCIQMNAVTSNIYVQMSISDSDNGLYNGMYDIGFGFYTSQNISDATEVWYEEHADIYISEGNLSELLGEITPLDYTYFEDDELYLGLSFIDTGDEVFIPVASAPTAIYSQFAKTARELEFTSDWLKFSTENYRVGIGVTQNISNELDVDGTISTNILLASRVSASILVGDGYDVTNIQFSNIVNTDDFSLHQYGSNDDDIIFVTSEGYVGVGFLTTTSDISSDFHVSGDVQIDGGLNGAMNIEISGDTDIDTSTVSGNQLIWNSNKASFRVGYATGETWSADNSGEYSVAFGDDTKVLGDGGFSAGIENIVNGIASISLGNSNLLQDGDYSAILSGDGHEMYGNYSVIVGGYTNELGSVSADSDYSGILFGTEHELVDGDYSAILSGNSNYLDGDYSIIVGGENNDIQSDNSFAFGSNIAVAYDNTVVFSDSQSSEVNILSPSDSDQFLIYAQNGVGIGISTPNTTLTVSVADLSSYTPANNSLRVAGDVIAINGDHTLGYIIGDGTYLTNVTAVWSEDSMRILFMWMK